MGFNFALPLTTHIAFRKTVLSLCLSLLVCKGSTQIGAYIYSTLYSGCFLLILSDIGPTPKTRVWRQHYFHFANETQSNYKTHSALRYAEHEGVLPTTSWRTCCRPCHWWTISHCHIFKSTAGLARRPHPSSFFPVIERADQPFQHDAEPWGPVLPEKPLAA